VDPSRQEELANLRLAVIFQNGPDFNLWHSCSTIVAEQGRFCPNKDLLSTQLYIIESKQPGLGRSVSSVC